MLLTDPGTLEYVGNTADGRTRFRGTSAHNTLCVDGQDQADGIPPFAWANLPAVKIGALGYRTGIYAVRGHS